MSWSATMAPARYPPNLPPYDPFGDQFSPGGVLPGERIGAPPPSRGKRMLRRGLALMVLAAAGWGLIQHRAAVYAWTSAAAETVRPLLASMSSSSQSARRTAQGGSAPGAAVSAMSMTALPERVVPAVKPTAFDAERPVLPPAAKPAPAEPAAGSPPPAATAALVPPVKSGQEPPASPLPPAVADPSDPYQVRAKAAGLHPGLSRVLLARLSAEDYRNASIAIEQALAGTSDKTVFVWPRQRKPETALFKVHFVPGAAPDCRRYVVTITKDRWSTTALPMERCGAKLGTRRISHQQRS